MKTIILNATSDGICSALTTHYHKEGWSNILGGGVEQNTCYWDNGNIR